MAAKSMAASGVAASEILLWYRYEGAAFNQDAAISAPSHPIRNIAGCVGSRRWFQALVPGPNTKR